jgi:hypothetical protein
MLILSRVRAKVAGKDANVSRLYMKITVEVYLVSVQPLRYMGSKCPYKRQLSALKKQNAFLFGKAFLLLYFLCYAEQTAI